MASRPLTITVGVIALAASFTAVAEDGLCKPLRKFISSTRPNETHVLKFHTSWGANFKDEAKDDDEFVFWAKRCEHGDYDPAKAVCDYLMEYGMTEFSGNNAKAAISCLSKSRFATGMQINAISISITVGTENRGSLVDVEFAEDTSVGGMVLSITADGY